MQPAVLFPGPDEIVLGYPSPFPASTAARRQLVTEGKSGGFAVFLRLARIGSTASRPRRTWEHPPLAPGRYVLHDADRYADLSVGETKAKRRPYTLRWAQGTTEEGELECIDVRDDTACDGHRFVPRTGTPRLMHVIGAGQFTLTEVATEAALKKGQPPEGKRGWTVYPLEGL